MRLISYRSVLHEAAGALGSGWEHTQICILRERSDRLAASEASLAVACERSEASVTAIYHKCINIRLKLPQHQKSNIECKLDMGNKDF